MQAFDNVLTTDEDFKVLKLLSDEQIEAIVRTNSDRLSQLDDLLRSELGAMVQVILLPNARHNLKIDLGSSSQCGQYHKQRFHLLGERVRRPLICSCGVTLFAQMNCLQLFQVPHTNCCEYSTRSEK